MCVKLPSDWLLQSLRCAMATWYKLSSSKNILQISLLRWYIIVQWKNSLTTSFSAITKHTSSHPAKTPAVAQFCCQCYKCCWHGMKIWQFYVLFYLFGLCVAYGIFLGYWCQYEWCGIPFFGRPFVKWFALCYQTVVSVPSVCLSCPVCDVAILWPNGWMDQDETWHADRPWPLAHCVRWGPSTPSP